MINKVKSLFSDIVLQKKIKYFCTKLSRNRNLCGFNSINLDFLQENDKAKIIKDADRLCDGEYQIFNYPSYYIDNWNRDPVTGKKIKKKISCLLIKTSAMYNKVDIKNYWDQSHLYALITLAEAYYFSKKEKYIKKIFNILLTWQEENEVGKTINWKCPMNNAIRLANISAAMGIVQSTYFFRKYKTIVVEIIYKHILYIISNYEDKGEKPNNHLLSDLIGVIWGCVFLKKNFLLYEVDSILDNALKKLCNEIERQVNKDGGDYENSSYYHCFVTEMISETISMLYDNNIEFPNKLDDISKKMLGICEYLGVFDSFLPLFGDQDGSRLFLLQGFFDFNRCDFTSLNRFKREYSTYLSAGIFRYDYKQYRVFVKCGGIGTDGKGTHDHNDQLSICLYIHNMPVIIDGGTYAYTFDTKARNIYRSEKKHSTINILNYPQNDIESNIFAIKGNRKGRVLQNKTSFKGELVLSNILTVSRSIFFEEDSIIIKDKIKGNTEEGIITFLLPISIEKIITIGKNIVKIELDDKMLFYIQASSEIIVSKENYSPAYGIEKEGMKIETKISNNSIYFRLWSEKKCLSEV